MQRDRLVVHDPRHRELGSESRAVELLGLSNDDIPGHENNRLLPSLVGPCDGCGKLPAERRSVVADGGHVGYSPAGFGRVVQPPARDRCIRECLLRHRLLQRTDLRRPRLGHRATHRELHRQRRQDGHRHHRLPLRQHAASAARSRRTRRQHGSAERGHRGCGARGQHQDPPTPGRPPCEEHHAQPRPSPIRRRRAGTQWLSLPVHDHRA